MPKFVNKKNKANYFLAQRHQTAIFETAIYETTASLSVVMSSTLPQFVFTKKLLRSTLKSVELFKSVVQKMCLS